MKLQGTYTALITPFLKNEEIDFDSLKKIIENQVQAGIEGLVPCGTTGESPTLNFEEHRKVIEKTVEWAKSLNEDISIIAGTGSNSTKEAIELTKSASSDGADFALIVNPYYNKPSQEGLYRHYSKIANESKIPVILYNIPGRTAVSLSVDTISRLSKHGNIAGIKEATGDLSFMAEVIANTSENFTLLSGDDNLILPVLSIGGKGVISVISNLFPKEIADITRQFFSGNIDESRKIFFKFLPLMKAMFMETNPVPVKAAMAIRGDIQNVLRLPMTELSAENQSKLVNLLKGYI
jgi:4-hydroxy-tetrahydrodipicolinate synthase